MTTDLKSKAFELDDLLEQYWNAAYAEGWKGVDHDTENADAQRILIEIQAALTAHDAEMKAQALEETIEMAEKESEDTSHWSFKQEILYKAVQLLRQKAAEYRAKAKP